MQQSNLPFANDGSFFETFKKLQQQQGQAMQPQQEEGSATAAKEVPGAAQARAVASAPPVEAAAAASTSATEEREYIQAAQFGGAKTGYVFKMGDEGLGYYKDVPLHKRKAAPAKPVVLKSKSIVKVPLRAVPSGDSKKRKLDDDKTDSKPQYLKEMERYRAMSCGSDTKHDRPLVK